MSKITTGLALGVGYVLGARSGRERYDQIVATAKQVSQRPEVKQATGKVTSVAKEKVGSVRGRSSSDVPSSYPTSYPATGDVVETAVLIDPIPASDPLVTEIDDPAAPREF